MAVLLALVAFAAIAPSPLRPTTSMRVPSCIMVERQSIADQAKQQAKLLRRAIEDAEEELRAEVHAAMRA